MVFNADRGEIRLFAGISLQNPALHALLAIQKVVGSNPISRFKRLRFAGLFRLASRQVRLRRRVPNVHRPGWTCR
jgi:hypothetical protein